MHNVKRLLILSGVAATLAALVWTAVPLHAAVVKVADPTSVVMIVNRDFERHRVHGHQDQEDRRPDVPRQQRQPAHGDDVAGRPLRRHRRHAREQGLHHRRADARTGQGDPRRYRARSTWRSRRTAGGTYQGNPEGDSISVIDMVSLTKIKTIPGLVEPLNTVFLPDGSKAYVGNYGAHWVGVIDVRRHELLKKIQIADGAGRREARSREVSGRDQGHQHSADHQRRQVSLRGRTAISASSRKSIRARTRSSR